MDRLDEDDCDETDDRYPFTLHGASRLCSPNNSTVFMKSLLHRNKTYLQKEEKTIPTKCDSHQNLLPLDLAWSSPSSQKSPHRNVKLRRTSLASVLTFDFGSTSREKRSQSVPLVQTSPLRATSAACDGPTSTIVDRAPSGRVCGSVVETYDNRIAGQRSDPHLILDEQNPPEERPALRNQDCQTEVIIPVDEMLLSYDFLRPEDQSTVASSDARGATSTVTSNGSIRKYDQIPFYQRKLISWGASEIFAANMCHPYRAFRRYPGFSRDELLALQCVLYIWGVLIVITAISFYLII